MALSIPDSFDFDGADWEQPDPFDSRYWNSLYEAIRERFTQRRDEFALRSPLVQNEAAASDLPYRIAEYLKDYIACECGFFCTPHFYDTGTFEFPHFLSRWRDRTDYETWSIPAMEQKIGRVPVPSLLSALPIESAEFLIQAKKALELLTIQESTGMDYHIERWKYSSISASAYWRWQDLSSGHYDWPMFWDLAISRFMNEMPSLQSVGISENSSAMRDTPFTSRLMVDFTHNFDYGEPDHIISISFEATIPEVEFCEKINGRNYRPSIFAKNEGDLPIYLPEISPEKRIFKLDGKTQDFKNPNFDLSSIFEQPEEPVENGEIFSRTAALTFGHTFADFRVEGGYRFL